MRTNARLAVLLLLLCLPALLGCERAVVWWLSPGAFDAADAPPAPDYAEPASWAALPDRDDRADQVPPGSGALDRQSEAAVDVFFVHPTTYYKNDSFNAPVDDADTKRITDEGVMAIQASAFNGAARIYAPRYRQMALGGYFGPDKEAGLALAYRDVERAFDYYLEHWNAGRPFFLASHSQGSRHLQTLLVERFGAGGGGELRDRLVAAYLIGGWLPERRYAGEAALIPACEAATDTGCVIGWRTATEDARPRVAAELAPGDRNLCTNPLLWTRGPEPAGPERNLGSLPLRWNRDGQLPPADVGLVGARCNAGWLEIDRRPDAEGYDFLVRRGDFHVYDYALFYMNLRENARRRADAFLAGRRPTP